MQEIQLNQALDLMKLPDDYGRPKPFSIAFVKYNAAKNSGGQIAELAGVTLAKNNARNDRNDIIDLLVEGLNPVRVHKHLIISFNNMHVYL